MPLVTRPAEQLPKDYIALDLETTGLSAQRDRITEIGAVKIRDGRITDRYAQLVNPGVLISPRITQITGITNAMSSISRPSRMCSRISSTLSATI